MEKVRSKLLFLSEVLQSIRHSDNVEKIFQEITAKLINSVQARHVAIYQLDKCTDQPHEIDISGKIVAEAIAPNCEPCSQEQIENILREEYQWGQDIIGQIIDLYTAGVSRCEINLAEIFAGKAYLLIPIVLSENAQNNTLWGFLTVHQCSGLNGEAFGALDEDDVLTLQQIAMQIEMGLLKDNALVSYQQTEAVAKNITEELLCTLEELRVSNEELITLHQETEHEKFRFQNLFVVLYLVYGEWCVPWSFKVWRGKGYASPSDLACKLLGTVPKQLTQGKTVIVLADTEFSTVKFFNAVRAKTWRIVVGVRNNRKLQDGRTVKQIYRHGNRGQKILLEGLSTPLTISWFWLKRADSKRELRFVVSSHPYSGAYLLSS